MTGDEAFSELVNERKVEEEVASVIVGLLEMYGPFEVHLGLPAASGGEILIITSHYQGEFEVKLCATQVSMSTSAG